MKIKKLELISLILMLFPFLSLIGFLIYVIMCGAAKGNIIKLVVAILTIPFGLIAAIFLWLDAFNVINLDKIGK